MNKCTKALIIDKGHDYVHTKLIFWYINSKIPEKNKQLLEQVIIDNLPKQDTEVIMRSIADSYIDQGINKGIAIGITNTALSMLKHNFDINTISSVTGLSQKEITQLKNKT